MRKEVENGEVIKRERNGFGIEGRDGVLRGIELELGF